MEQINNRMFQPRLKPFNQLVIILQFKNLLKRWGVTALWQLVKMAILLQLVVASSSY